MYKVFIDGREGTTGLRIFERLEKRDDIEITVLPEELRKDPGARREAINSSDAAFLCLPDAAAAESADMVKNGHVRIFDTSTAHRTAEGWAYGFPELSKEHMENIKNSQYVAVPGCHASGFIALVYPLVKAGILPKSAHLSCFSLTGYSGGGKKMIAQYEGENREELLRFPRQYGLTQNHKHLKEMRHVTELDSFPAFSPIVGDFYSGMCVTVPLFADDINGSIEDIRRVYSGLYSGDIVRYVENADEDGFIAAGTYAGRDSMEIAVFGNEDRIILNARYDNLGKGASGAAIECLNIAMGVSPEKGLEL